MSSSLPDDASRADLTRHHAERRVELLSALLPANPFYTRKLDTLLRGPVKWHDIPFTTKAELLADQEAHPPYGSNLTAPIERYNRLHQTSGSSGKPLRWLDTHESWWAMLDCWNTIYRVVGLRPDDRLIFPFSFGPFLGFWTAFESAVHLGAFCLPAGGMSSKARLRHLLDNAATIVLCTPTYALHLTEVAAAEGIDLRSSPVRMLIVAGEPGGNIPSTRQRIEGAWGARLIDHSGMTEIGPLMIECPEAPGGLHVLEDYCQPEVIDPASGSPVPPGTLGELVLTTFHRVASPLVRYRTGDLVCADPNPCPCGRSWLRLVGGIRGRVDDMIVLRGNNVYPSAIQAILHSFAEVVEYRVTVDRSAALADLRIEVELRPEVKESVLPRIDEAVREALLFRAAVRAVPPGTLPRFEMKARRIVLE
jgi:phenylacetate-CoA ligase